MTRKEVLSDIARELEGALVNSEGKDFQISADFVREIICALAEQSTAGQENKAGAASSGAGFKATDSLLGPVPSRRLPNNPALPPPPERRKGQRRERDTFPTVHEIASSKKRKQRKSDRRSALTREEIEEWRIAFHGWSECNGDSAARQRRELDALCDLALKGLER